MISTVGYHGQWMLKLATICDVLMMMVLSRMIKFLEWWRMLGPRVGEHLRELKNRRPQLKGCGHDGSATGASVRLKVTQVSTFG